MKRRKTTISFVIAALVILLAGLSSGVSAEPYTGTIYGAGQGGHLAVVDVTIDPSDTINPITVDSLQRIKLGNSPMSKPEDYIFHDTRIDMTRGKSGKLFWSTIMPDSEGKFRYGRIDLQEKRVEYDIQMVPPSRSAAGSPPGYCGSGQSADYYLPVWMGYEGFVDVIDKDTMNLVRRVFLDQTLPHPNYRMAHGTNKDDFSQMTISKNFSSDVPGYDNTGKDVNLNMSDLLNGITTIENEGPPIQGPPGTVFFRQDWTPDGQYLLQAGRSFLLVLDSGLNEVCRYNLPVVNGKQVENHDITAVKNSGYGVMQQRRYIMRSGSAVMDGQLQLVDISNCTPIGNPVSMCMGCHDKNNVERSQPNQQEPGGSIRLTTPLVTCGIDSVWD